LLTPYRPLKGMLVAHASSEAKIHCRKCPLNLWTAHWFQRWHREVWTGFLESGKPGWARLDPGCGRHFVIWLRNNFETGWLPHPNGPLTPSPPRPSPPGEAEAAMCLGVHLAMRKPPPAAPCE